MHPTHIPLRLATGAFILNSGLGKLGADEETAAGLHGMASGAYPVFAKMKPKDFTELLAYGEIALGAALLAPMVPSAAAGVGLTGFGGALVGLYLRTPGMTQKDGIRPTQQGTGIAKDVWLVGAGITLATQGVFGAARSAVKNASSVADAASSSAKGLATGLTKAAKESLPTR